MHETEPRSLARKPIIGGNWKMNTVRATAVELAAAVAKGVSGADVDVAVFPPFVYLDAVAQALRDGKSRVLLGAQDVYFEPTGAFTGEVSAMQLRDIGVSIVLVGHSERRHVIGEGDEVVSRKLRAALAAGLQVVLCIGETLEQRERAETNAVNERQLRAALDGLDPKDAERLVIAYEPVWAIGTGRNASPADAQAAHAHIRRVLGEVCGVEGASGMRIQYGGSLKAENAPELFAQPDVDGGLVGGASLKAPEFVAICDAAKARSRA
jgi:triosephosphate isomerase